MLLSFVLTAQSMKYTKLNRVRNFVRLQHLKCLVSKKIWWIYENFRSRFLFPPPFSFVVLFLSLLLNLETTIQPLTLTRRSRFRSTVRQFHIFLFDFRQDDSHHYIWTTRLDQLGNCRQIVDHCWGRQGPCKSLNSRTTSTLEEREREREGGGGGSANQKQKWVFYKH